MFCLPVVQGIDDNPNTQRAINQRKEREKEGPIEGWVQV
jgi:hypothetical protein